MWSLLSVCFDGCCVSTFVASPRTPRRFVSSSGDVASSMRTCAALQLVMRGGGRVRRHTITRVCTDGWRHRCPRTETDTRRRHYCATAVTLSPSASDQASTLQAATLHYPLPSPSVAVYLHLEQGRGELSYGEAFVIVGHVN